MRTDNLLRRNDRKFRRTFYLANWKFELKVVYES